MNCWVSYNNNNKFLRPCSPIHGNFFGCTMLKHSIFWWLPCWDFVYSINLKLQYDKLPKWPQAVRFINHHCYCITLPLHRSLDNSEEFNKENVNLEINWMANNIDCRSKEPYQDIGHVRWNHDRNASLTMRMSFDRFLESS